MTIKLVKAQETGWTRREPAAHSPARTDKKSAAIPLHRDKDDESAPRREPSTRPGLY